MEIGFEMKMISQKIKKKIGDTPVFRETRDLTRIQGWVLRFLYDREKTGEYTFQRDVEKMFQIRRSTATELLNTMEQNGYIARSSYEKDARLKKLSLTEKACCLQKRIIDSINRVEESLTEGFTDFEKETLIRLLEKINQNLEK